jgi:signal transduction histidine kinase
LTALIIGAGVSLAVVCAAPFDINWPTSPALQAWPVSLFGLAAASLLSRSELQISRRKTEALIAYAGYIAHEVRTPLASIAARATLTREDSRGVHADRDLHLAELSREVERTFSLIDILLTNVDPVRHDKQQTKEPHAGPNPPVPVSNIIAEALTRYPFRDAAERDQVRVSVEEDCMVRGSSLLLQHVLMNLVRNAFEHCRGEPAVALGITARRRATECEISITDNGPGITPGPTSRAGLGLTFCRSVVRSIGGELRTLASASGGCTMVLSLPSAS